MPLFLCLFFWWTFKQSFIFYSRLNACVNINWMFFHVTIFYMPLRQCWAKCILVYLVLSLKKGQNELYFSCACVPRRRAWSCLSCGPCTAPPGSATPSPTTCWKIILPRCASWRSSGTPYKCRCDRSSETHYKCRYVYYSCTKSASMLIIYTLQVQVHFWLF